VHRVGFTTGNTEWVLTKQRQKRKKCLRKEKRLWGISYQYQKT